MPLAPYSIPPSGSGQPNALDTAQKVYGLQSLVNRQALQQQQIQQQTMQKQQMQQEMNDERAHDAALRQWDANNMEDLPDLILKNGGSSDAWKKAKQNVLAYQMQQSGKTELQLRNDATIGDVVARKIDAVKALPLTQQPAAWQDMTQELVHRGYWTPQDAMQHPYAGPESLDNYQKFYMSHAQQSLAAARTVQVAQANSQAAVNQPLGAMSRPVNPVGSRRPRDTRPPLTSFYK